MTNAEPTPRRFRPPVGGTAIAVVDIQARLMPAMDPAHAPRFMKGVRTLLELARVRGFPVVATEQYPQGLGPTVPEIVADLEAARAGAPVQKMTFSACGAPEFLARVGEAAAVIVVGVEAHVCVLETALDLLGEGKTVFVPWDGIASRREEDRHTALELLRAAGAIVSSSETIAFQALGRAGTPEFKAVSARIR